MRVHRRLAASALEDGDDWAARERRVARRDLFEIQRLYRLVVVTLGHAIEAAKIARSTDLDHNFARCRSRVLACPVKHRLRRREEAQAAERGDGGGMASLQVNGAPVVVDRGPRVP